MNDPLKKACALSAEKTANAIPEDMDYPAFSASHANKISQIEDSLTVKKRYPVIKVMVAAAIIVTLSLSVFASTDAGKYVIEKVRGHMEFSVNDPYEGDLKEGITVGAVPDGYHLDFDIQTEKYSFNYYISMDEAGYQNGYIEVSKFTSDTVYCYDDGFYCNRDMIERGNRTYVSLWDTEISPLTGNTSPVIDRKLLWNEGDYIYAVTFRESRDEEFDKGFTIEEMLVIADTIK